MAADKDIVDNFPLSYASLHKEQNRDEILQLRALQSSAAHSMQKFHGGGNTYSLLCKEGKICVPARLQERSVEWHHNTLCHPGETRTEATTRQHFDWPGLREMVHKHFQGARHAS